MQLLERAVPVDKIPRVVHLRWICGKMFHVAVRKPKLVDLVIFVPHLGFMLHFDQLTLLLNLLSTHFRSERDVFYLCCFGCIKSFLGEVHSVSLVRVKDKRLVELPVKLPHSFHFLGVKCIDHTSHRAWKRGYAPAGVHWGAQTWQIIKYAWFENLLIFVHQRLVGVDGFVQVMPQAVISCIVWFSIEISYQFAMILKNLAFVLHSKLIEAPLWLCQKLSVGCLGVILLWEFIDWLVTHSFRWWQIFSLKLPRLRLWCPDFISNGSLEAFGSSIEELLVCHIKAIVLAQVDFISFLKGLCGLNFWKFHFFIHRPNVRCYLSDLRGVKTLMDFLCFVRIR